jgi:enamine deaminase RidA (YjgF/YER057c/UK114 family)
MTKNNVQILVSNIKDDQSYCTRDVDGVSGMTVTALSEFCGTSKSAITQLLNQISDSDPFTNELAECLKQFAGNDWRLFTNDPSGSAFIIDEVCHAVLEYYALEARKYKGKQIAINNYRMIAKAGLRVFIWSQTGYSPKNAISQAVITKEELSATITAAVEQALTPINQRLEQIEQRLSALLNAKPKRPWTLPSNTPPEQIPEGYQQLEDGSWLSPEAYESILRQSRRSLPWDIRRLRDFE